MMFDLCNLSAEVSSRMSSPRFNHTLGVYKLASILADFCIPEKKLQIAVAALLHDVTKEFSYEQHIALLEEYGVDLPFSPKEYPQLLHSFSAPYLIKKDFPEYATAEILSAIEKHTVGDSEMSIMDEVIFVADYAEEGRTYFPCIDVRNFLVSSMKKSDLENNRIVLHRACIMAIDNTVNNLVSKSVPVAQTVYLARKALIDKIL